MSTIDPATNPKVERQTRAFLQALNSAGDPPLETLPPNEARQVLVGAQASAHPPLPDCTVEEKTVSHSGQNVSLTIVRPTGSSGTSPAFLFIHGGGWILGDFPTHERFVRDLVVASGYPAVFVNYSPSPEARYPVALNEIYAAAEWLTLHGSEVNIDGTRLALVGNSAGGNMAAATALKALHQNGPKFRCQILFWPVTDANFETDSYREYADGYFLTRSMMQWFWNAYVPDSKNRQDIYASPLQAIPSQLTGLPPALVQVAGNDVLRDEGIAYARKLDAAGVDVTLVNYEGFIHDYGLLNALATIPSVQDALTQAAQMLRKHLQ